MLLDTKVLYLTLKKAFFQDTKGQNPVINRLCTMPFGVHRPLIHIYTHTKFQWNRPKHFQDMALDTKVLDGRKDGRKNRQKDANAKTLISRCPRRMNNLHKSNPKFTLTLFNVRASARPFPRTTSGSSWLPLVHSAPSSAGEWCWGTVVDLHMAHPQQHVTQHHSFQVARQGQEPVDLHVDLLCFRLVCQPTWPAQQEHVAYIWVNDWNCNKYYWMIFYARWWNRI